MFAPQKKHTLPCLHLKAGTVLTNAELTTQQIKVLFHLSKNPLHHFILSQHFYVHPSLSASTSLQLLARPLDFGPSAVLQHSALLTSSTFTVLQVISSTQGDSIIITQPVTLKFASSVVTCHSSSIYQHLLTILIMFMCRRCKQKVNKITQAGN